MQGWDQEKQFLSHQGVWYRGDLLPHTGRQEFWKPPSYQISWDLPSCRDNSDMLSFFCQCFSHIWFLWFPWISDAWEGPLPSMPAGLWALFSHLFSANFFRLLCLVPILSSLISGSISWTQSSLGWEKKCNQDTAAFQYSLDSLPGNFHY